MCLQCRPAEAALLSDDYCKSIRVETHKACGRGEVKPAVFDDRARAIANHVLDVVIETVSTCNQGEMRETQRRLSAGVKIHSVWTA